MKVAVIGDGGWGTALAVLTQNKGISTALWGAFPENVNQLVKKQENKKFLPGIKIPSEILITNDLGKVLDQANLIVLAVPSQFMRPVLRKIAEYKLKKVGYLTVAKGIEAATAKCMSVVIKEELGNIRLAALSGPNIAYEVAKAIPSAAVCASTNKKLASMVQDVFMTPEFRVYTASDLHGIELAGAFKNIIAIACGISDGLGFGVNTKAALLTRGLAEITRLGVAMGACYKTFNGLAGMGDLVTTCFSLRSRNRWFGEQIGSGKKMADILKNTSMVVEGALTTKTALKLAKKYNVVLPITQAVYKVLYQEVAPISAMRLLMQRQKKNEI
ncbi:MAG: NAD(P)-dependent glycerol-3-phosphate dehydrogenase [Candidatus Omnitrophica bacterium]|nr:NAD(P)-dependent glycerol-3-phosphate dehydrogenase [Candidatus Omnitrophota bacterium]